MVQLHCQLDSKELHQESDPASRWFRRSCGIRVVSKRRNFATDDSPTRNATVAFMAGCSRSAPIDVFEVGNGGGRVLEPSIFDFHDEPMPRGAYPLRFQTLGCENPVVPGFDLGIRIGEAELTRASRRNQDSRTELYCRLCLSPPSEGGGAGALSLGSSSKIKSEPK
jgi:hypothetical protein